MGEKDIVAEAREFVVTSALWTNPSKSRRLIEALANEVERARGNRPRIKEAMLDEILDCDKCGLCEDHHG